MKNPPMKADHDGIGTNQIFKFLKHNKYQIMREEKNLKNISSHKNLHL
jgi:phage antirepressor YoqD-like protein